MGNSVTKRGKSKNRGVKNQDSYLPKNRETESFKEVGCDEDELNSKTDMYAQKKTIEDLTRTIQTLQQDTKAKDDELNKKNEEICRLKDKIVQLNSVIEKLSSKTNNLLEPINEEKSGSGNSLVKLKKQGLSGETLEGQAVETPLKKHPKSDRAKKLIRGAIAENEFLNKLDASQTTEVVDCMYEEKYSKGDYVIKEGHHGDRLFVSSEGELEVSKHGKFVRAIEPGRAFGELAILYNCTRTASVQAKEDVYVWALDRRAFKIIMMQQGMELQNQKLKFLQSVPNLSKLPKETLEKLADALEVESFSADEHIIREGNIGDTLYILNKGEVKVLKKKSDTGEIQELRRLGSGEFFGELALLGEEKRTASVVAVSPEGVECLTLDRRDFNKLFGSLKDVLENVDYTDDPKAQQRGSSSKTPSPKESMTAEFDSLQLKDLKFKAVLGRGGFGLVELVQNKNDSNKTFALKCLKKKHIVETKQQAHVFSEKKILLKVNSPFIVKLYKTYKDPKYVYMLLEVCLGGELWTILRDRGHFKDDTSRFYIACVLEALAYLHKRGIVYRDLKPENLLVCSNGYIKLVDFGFAKYLGQSGTSKTWTFCGTPEYVAPEVILNKGHSFAVDYWAVGILMYELLHGSPPFFEEDPMKTYNHILKGINAVDFSKRISRNAQNLIKSLCREQPSDRLGYGKGGISEIRKHRWFQGFDWSNLQEQKLKAPIVPKIKSNLDTTNFDEFSRDPREPPDELSGWDDDF